MDLSRTKGTAKTPNDVLGLLAQPLPHLARIRPDQLYLAHSREVLLSGDTDLHLTRKRFQQPKFGVIEVIASRPALESLLGAKEDRIRL
jgi:hypothetical protein